MNIDEIKKLLVEIKIMYPRFDSAEKDGPGYRVIPAVAEAWHRRIGWMEYDQAIRILDRYMESPDGTRVPNLAIFLNGGQRKTAGGDATAWYDRRHSVICWEPEPGTVFEIPASWNQAQGCIEDDEGRMWATAGV